MMKPSYYKIIYYFLWILGLAVMQSTLLNYVRIFGVIPNLFLVFVISVAIMSGSPVESAIIGFISGFMLDSMTGHTIGPNMFLLMYAGVLNGIVFKRLIAGQYFGMFVTILLTSLAYYFLEYSLNFVIWGHANLGLEFLFVTLVATVYNAAVCVPLLLAAKKGFRKSS